jgi:uncharacterized membrane protein YhhN
MTTSLLPTLLTLAAALTGVLHIRAEFAGARRQVYLLKPLTTTLILAAALALPAADGVYRGLVAAGLICSLAGDIFLMLPRDAFLPGMVSFFLAHLLYIAAFTRPHGWSFAPVALALLAIFGVGYAVLLWPKLGALRLPVLAYIAAILIMAWQAIGRWQVMGTPAAGRAALGALSFVVSDASLAWDRFRGRFQAAPAVVLGTYYLAQTSIAWSITG